MYININIENNTKENLFNFISKNILNLNLHESSIFLIIYLNIKEEFLSYYISLNILNFYFTAFSLEFIKLNTYEVFNNDDYFEFLIDKFFSLVNFNHLSFNEFFIQMLRIFAPNMKSESFLAFLNNEYLPKTFMSNFYKIILNIDKYYSSTNSKFRILEFRKMLKYFKLYLKSLLKYLSTEIKYKTKKSRFKNFYKPKHKLIIIKELMNFFNILSSNKMCISNDNLDFELKLYDYQYKVENDLNVYENLYNDLFKRSMDEFLNSSLYNVNMKIFNIYEFDYFYYISKYVFKGIKKLNTLNHIRQVYNFSNYLYNDILDLCSNFELDSIIQYFFQFYKKSNIIYNTFICNDSLNNSNKIVLNISNKNDEIGLCYDFHSNYLNNLNEKYYNINIEDFIPRYKRNSKKRVNDLDYILTHKNDYNESIEQEFQDLPIQVNMEYKYQYDSFIQFLDKNKNNIFSEYSKYSELDKEFDKDSLDFFDEFLNTIE